MITVLKLVVVLVIGLLVMLWVAGQLGLLRGRPPATLGVRDGRLAPPSKTPNSVSSQASLYPDHPQHDYAGIAPLAYTGVPRPPWTGSAPCWRPPLAVCW
jgi:hypothetical protein